MKLRLLSPVLSLLFAVVAVQAQQKTVTIATVNNQACLDFAAAQSDHALIKVS
jgi:hypothetical protein